MNDPAQLTRDGHRIMPWLDLPRLMFTSSTLAAMEDPRYTLYKIKRAAWKDEHERHSYETPTA